MSEFDSWGAYATDADEALADIEMALLSLESSSVGSKDPSTPKGPIGADPAMVNQLYRGLHTIKGNSGFLQLKCIEKVAHAAESVVGMVRDQGRALDSENLALLFVLVDMLRSLIASAAEARANVDDPKADEAVAKALALSGATSPTGEDTEGLHLFEDDEPDEAGADDGEALGFDEGLDDAGFFRALAGSLWTAIDSGADDKTTALADLARAAHRTGHVAVARAVEACQTAPGPGSLEALRLLLAALDVRSATSDVDGGASVTTLAPSHVGGRAPLAEGDVAVVVAETLASTARAKAPNPVVAKAAPAKATPIEQTLKIDGRKATSLMALTGELGLAVHAVTRHPGLTPELIEGFQAAAHRLETLVTELQGEAAGLRLIPVASVFARMRRVVRDTCLRTEKEAELVIVGDETEIDKAMVDRLHDPLVHVIRNAIDHGLCTPAERIAKGKKPAGRILLQAAHRGGLVEIVIADDGRGVDLANVRKRAVERGLCSADGNMSDDEIINLLFTPGFSTAAKVTELSGRGVGLDVLRSTIEMMHGTVRLSSIKDAGMRLEITLPLTVAFLEAMVVRVHGWLLAVPIEKVHHVERVAANRLVSDPASGAVLVRFDDGLVPLVRLDRFFGSGAATDSNVTHGANVADGADQLLVVAHAKRGRLAFPVDALLGNQQVMLKPMTGVLQNIRASAGYGVLRSGDVALTLDCEHIHAN